MEGMLGGGPAGGAGGALFLLCKREKAEERVRAGWTGEVGIAWQGVGYEGCGREWELTMRVERRVGGGGEVVMRAEGGGGLPAGLGPSPRQLWGCVQCHRRSHRLDCGGGSGSGASQEVRGVIAGRASAKRRLRWSSALQLVIGRSHRCVAACSIRVH